MQRFPVNRWLHMAFTVSARGKDENQPILVFLGQHFGNIPINDVDSIFGFVEHTPLYGGRIFNHPELIDRDVRNMYAVGIGLRLPLSNLFVEREDYEASRALLEKYHRPGNAVIITSDDLAAWIRRDYPDYRIEASVIKNINSHDKIAQTLDSYDTVVLPMSINEQPEFLKKIKDKDRITLFANAGCALTCPSKLCYPSISKINRNHGEGEFKCSQDLKYRELRGMIDFDLDALRDMGFSRFKILRSRKGDMTGY